MFAWLFPRAESPTGQLPGTLDPWWYTDEPQATVGGVAVNDKTALKYSAVWAATRFLCETANQMPLFLYERLENGGRRLAVEHPHYALVHDQPNPVMTFDGFWDFVTQNQINGGNGYAEIERDGRGNAVALWPIHNTRVESKLLKRGEAWFYLVRNDDGTAVMLPWEDVLHVPGALSLDGVFGRSIVWYSTQSIGMGLATEQFGTTFFENNARPGLVIMHPGELGSEAILRLREKWKAQHRGPKNAHGVAVLDEGMSVKEFGFSAEAAQFLETRQFNVQEISRWYRLPPHVLGDLSRATFSNIEQQSKDKIDGVLPWTSKRERALTQKLLRPDERSRYFIEHQVNGLLRGDSAARARFYREMFNIGVFSVNRILALENENPIGPSGDRHFVNGAMVPLDKLLADQSRESTSDEEDMPDNTRGAVDADEVAAATGKVVGPLVESAAARVLHALHARADQHVSLGEQLLAVLDARSARIADVIAAASEVTGGRIQDCEICVTQARDTLHADLATVAQTTGEAIAGVTAGYHAAQTAMRETVASGMTRAVKGTLERFVSIEANEARRAAKRPEQFLTWLDEFYVEHQTKLRAALDGAWDALQAVADVPAIETCVAAHVAESRRQLLEAAECRPQQLQESVETCVATWAHTRTTITATTRNEESKHGDE